MQYTPAIYGFTTSITRPQSNSISHPLQSPVSVELWMESPSDRAQVVVDFGLAEDGRAWHFFRGDPSTKPFIEERGRTVSSHDTFWSWVVDSMEVVERPFLVIWGLGADGSAPWQSGI